MRKLFLFTLSFCLIAFSCQETENETSQITEASTIKLNSFRKIFKEGFENASSIIQDDDFLQNTNGARRSSVKSYVKLTKSQYQGFGDFMNIMYSSESLAQYIESVIEYLSYIEQSDIEPSDKLFAYEIGAISIESGIYWDNVKNIVNLSNANLRVLCPRNNPNTWSWKEFAGEITAGAITVGVISSAAGGTASLGVLILPSWVVGVVLGGVGGGLHYAINDVFKSTEPTENNCCNSTRPRNFSKFKRPSSFSNPKRKSMGGNGPVPKDKQRPAIEYCQPREVDLLFIEDLKENWEPELSL